MNPYKLILTALALFLVCSCGNIIPDNLMDTPPTHPEEDNRVAIGEYPPPLNCATILEEPSWTNINALNGILILNSPNLNENYLFDFRAGDKNPITPGVATNFSTSPDRKWFAYIGAQELSTSDMLIVRSADNLTELKFPVDYEKWQTIAYWLNDQVLVLRNHAVPLDNVVLFNPFTGDTMVMNNEYPDILPDSAGWNHSWPSLTIYNSALEQVVYLAESKNGYRLGDVNLILWDVTEKHPVTKIKNIGYTLVYPIWKLDGSGLVFVKALPGLDPAIRQDEWFF